VAIPAVVRDGVVEIKQLAVVAATGCGLSGEANIPHQAVEHLADVGDEHRPHQW
jgi:hypothetical protein